MFPKTRLLVTSTAGLHTLLTLVNVGAFRRSHMCCGVLGTRWQPDSNRYGHATRTHGVWMPLLLTAGIVVCGVRGNRRLASPHQPNLYLEPTWLRWHGRARTHTAAVAAHCSHAALEGAHTWAPAAFWWCLRPAGGRGGVGRTDTCQAWRKSN